MITNHKHPITACTTVQGIQRGNTQMVRYNKFLGTQRGVCVIFNSNFVISATNCAIIMNNENRNIAAK